LRSSTLPKWQMNGSDIPMKTGLRYRICRNKKNPAIFIDDKTNIQNVDNTEKPTFEM
jgi:hypothetical protein